jgi:hypothetical protein
MKVVAYVPPGNATLLPRGKMAITYSPRVCSIIFTFSAGIHQNALERKVSVVNTKAGLRVVDALKAAFRSELLFKRKNRADSMRSIVSRIHLSNKITASTIPKVIAALAKIGIKLTDPS